MSKDPLMNAEVRTGQGARRAKLRHKRGRKVLLAATDDVKKSQTLSRPENPGRITQVIDGLSRGEQVALDELMDFVKRELYPFFRSLVYRDEQSVNSPSAVFNEAMADTWQWLSKKRKPGLMLANRHALLRLVCAIALRSAASRTRRRKAIKRYPLKGISSLRGEHVDRRQQTPQDQLIAEESYEQIRQVIEDQVAAEPNTIVRLVVIKAIHSGETAARAVAEVAEKYPEIRKMHLRTVQRRISIARSHICAAADSLRDGDTAYSRRD